MTTMNNLAPCLGTITEAMGLAPCLGGAHICSCGTTTVEAGSCQACLDWYEDAYDEAESQREQNLRDLGPCQDPEDDSWYYEVPECRHCGCPGYTTGHSDCPAN